MGRAVDKRVTHLQITKRHCFLQTLSAATQEPQPAWEWSLFASCARKHFFGASASTDLCASGSPTDQQVRRTQHPTACPRCRLNRNQKPRERVATYSTKREKRQNDAAGKCLAVRFSGEPLSLHGSCRQPKTPVEC